MKLKKLRPLFFKCIVWSDCYGVGRSGYIPSADALVRAGVV